MLYGVKPKLIYNNNCYILSLKNYSLLSKRVIRNKYPSPNYQDYLSNPVLVSYQALILSNNIAFIEPWGRDLKIIRKRQPISSQCTDTPIHLNPSTFRNNKGSTIQTNPKMKNKNWKIPTNNTKFTFTGFS